MIERIYSRAKTDGKARGIEINDRDGGWHLLVGMPRISVAFGPTDASVRDVDGAVRCG